MGNTISFTNNESSNVKEFDEKSTYLNDLSQSQHLLESLKLRTSNSLIEPSDTLKIDDFKVWEKEMLKDPKNQLALNTLSQSDFQSAISSRSAKINDKNVFNLVASDTKDITNQMSSGRCWLFSITNLLRNQVKIKLNLDEFQLSQSYLSFYDRLEKANIYLEHCIELSDLPIGNRLVDFINSSPIGDGGQFQMGVNLIEKYGVVPQSIYPESFNSSHTSKINELITTKLRQNGLELRELIKNTQHFGESASNKLVRKRKLEQMEEIYNALVIAFGPPPKYDEEFLFEYYDKNNKFNSIKSNPIDFYKNYLNGFKPNQWFSLINDPRNQYSKLYTVDKLQNVKGATPVYYVNTTTDRLIQQVIHHLKNGQPVFFGCDVTKFSDRVNGILDTKLYDYDLAFNLNLGLNKAQRLETGESAMTHAMVINAAHIVDGEVKRFRIENSWDRAGQDGYFICTPDWFKEYVYQVVVNRQLAPKDLIQVIDNTDEAIVLPAFDPMGALA